MRIDLAADTQTASVDAPLSGPIDDTDSGPRPQLAALLRDIAGRVETGEYDWLLTGEPPPQEEPAP
jgi:hypothetical protein